MPKAAIYCRISSDPDHDRLGVTRQERDCRALCQREGLEVAAVYVDDDVSAYSGKPRPEYAALCEALKNREVGIVVAWAPDRLHRSPRELEDFIDLLEAVRAKVVTVQSGSWDLSTASGRAVARTLGAWARFESEHKGDRIRRKMEANAEAGLPHGGPNRPFGYADDRVTIVSAEAKIVREAAKRIIAGETLRSVTAWLNATGTPTARGKRWEPQTVRGMLVNPRYAGLRAVGRGVRARVVGDGVWKAILDRATFERVRAILTDPARRTNRTARSYLLSGRVRCSRCEHVMPSKPRKDGPGGSTVRTYCCVADHGGCGGMRILADPLESLIADAVIEFLSHPEFRAAFVAQPDDDGAVMAELAGIDAKAADAAARWAAGELADIEWDAVRARLNIRRTELAALVHARARTPAVLASYVNDPETLRGEWRALAFDRRRAIVGAVLDAVVIGPAKPGTQAFDQERVIDVRWRK